MLQTTYQSLLLPVLCPWPKSNFEYNLCVTDKANQNLTAPQKELLCWHFRLGHRDMLATQHLLRGGHLGNDPLKLLAGKCTLPKCASCQFGKQKRKCATPKSTTQSPSPLSPTLKTNILHPGQRVLLIILFVPPPVVYSPDLGRTNNMRCTLAVASLWTLPPNMCMWKCM